MTFKHPFILPLFLLTAGVISLGAAYIAEYGFDLKPCVLCLYQRIPYAAIIAIALLSVFLIKHYTITKILYYLSVAIVLTGAVTAFYHVGVEHKWFEGPGTCSGHSGATAQTIEEMRAELIGTKAVRCDQPQFVFLTLSMAGWNMLWSIALSITTILLILKGKENE